MPVSYISTIAQNFNLQGTVLRAKAFGDGLINSTYLVTTDQKKYILQKINGQVFKDIPTLARNKVKITEHIRGQHEGKSLEFIPTPQGIYYFKDADGAYWQCSKFIENAITFSEVSSTDLAYEAGRAIACFQSYLTDLNPQGIADTIPHFHNTSKRIADLQQSIIQDVAHRKQEVEDLIRIAKQYERLVQDIDHDIQSGIIPTRLVHNDTKISNILFDQNHKAMCMIDLDTCMRGSVLHDFGDALRSGTNTGTEDSPTNVSMSLELFEGYAKGYLSIATTFLEDVELNHLAYAGILITYEQFIRFLADYLNGDTYYKIQHPKHNLERAQSQAKLLQSMISETDAMQAIIKKYSKP